MIYRKDKIPEDLQQFFVRAEIGLEESPTEYVNQMVEVFREVRRVLRPDGTLWVNLGDSYNAGRDGGHAGGKNQADLPRHAGINRSGANVTGLKPKDLVGIPWRFAFALQADGWYLRSDIIWAKGSCMPESVTDRPTKAHEYVFLFAHPDSKGRYFYDIDAVRETSVYGDHHAKYSGTHQRHKIKGLQESGALNGQNYQVGLQNKLKQPASKNKRSVWNVNPQPYSGSHFAVWPPALVEPMVRAGTSAHGVCASCGAPWKRIVERDEQPNAHGAGGGPKAAQSEAERLAGGIGRMDGGRRATEGSTFHNNPAKRPPPPATVGWEPTCECVDPGPPVPATVLDPFSGSATTGMVALNESRNYIGCDINPEFLGLAVARVEDRKAPTKGEAIVANVLDFFNLD